MLLPRVAITAIDFVGIAKWACFLSRPQPCHLNRLPLVGVGGRLNATRL